MSQGWGHVVRCQGSRQAREIARPSYGRPRNDMEEEGGLETRPTPTPTGSAVG